MADTTAVEFRGCDNLVVAKVTSDTKDGYVTGPVQDLAPIGSVGKETASNSETHYYDNKGMIQIRTVGEDTLTFAVPALALDRLAIITGATIDQATGAYLDSGSDPNETYALGYREQLTDGSNRYVWKLKGTFTTIPAENSDTKSPDINTNGQEIQFTAVDTVYEFTNGGSKKSVYIDERDGLCDLSTFFDSVQTPDTISGLIKADVTALTLDNSTATVAAGATTTLAATVTPATAPVTWSTSNAGVATVNNGVVTGIAGGVAVIIARAGNMAAACTVTVTSGS